MTKEEAWKQYYESDPSLFDSGLSENDLARIQNAFYEGFDTKEDKIADLKANFDYVLEGKELEIKELTEQIEKMKCCSNCKHFKFIGTSMKGFYTCMKDGENKGKYYRSCIYHEKWEMN